MLIKGDSMSLDYSSHGGTCLETLLDCTYYLGFNV